MLSVIIQSEGDVSKTLQVDAFPARIGKGRDCIIHLPSWRVGRHHAEIQRAERGFKLIDAGSLGGTWVNGERIVEFGPLQDTDEITIGNFRLRIRQPIGEPGARRGDEVAPTAHDGGVSQDDELRNYLALTEWRRQLHRRLLQTFDLRRIDVRQLSAGQLRDDARRLLQELIDLDADAPPVGDRERLIEDVLDEAIGLGPLEGLMSDPHISEIMVNRPDEIYVERRGRLERCRASFTSPEAVRAVIERIVAPLGRRIDESSPMVDARLPDGSRVNAIIPPLAIKGPAVTIRRFNKTLLSPSDLVTLGSASADMVEFLTLCVRYRKNIVISGGTGSGKTTLLNVLSNLIDDGERVLTIEDAAELRLRHEHLVSLEARPANAEGRGVVTIRDLVRNALRMRPDRIVVGECRGGEALDMLQAMNTGHDGSLTTVHANSPRDVISRLEVMVMMAGAEIPVSALREQIASAVDIIVQQARLPDGSRKITEIVEVTGMEGLRVLMNPLFRFERDHRNGRAGEGRFVPCDAVPSFYEPLMAAGAALDLTMFQSRSAENT